MERQFCEVSAIHRKTFPEQLRNSMGWQQLPLNALAVDDSEADERRHNNIDDDDISLGACAASRCGSVDCRVTL